MNNNNKTKQIEKLAKLEEKIFDVRDKKYSSKRKWDYCTWLFSKQMTTLQKRFRKQVEATEKATGETIGYDFSDLLC